MTEASRITIGDNGEHRFAAAHAALHDGVLEPLHGHTYLAALRLSGDPGPDGLVCDFAVAAAAFASVITPLKRRTLIAGCMPGARVAHQGAQIVIDVGGKHYSLPALDVVILPIANTSTEALAEFLLGEFAAVFAAPGVRTAELVLRENPSNSATAQLDLGGLR